MPKTMVLGAGMVGIAMALGLQARGHDVSLIDRRTLGEETSHADAGIIQSEAAAPIKASPFPRCHAWPRRWPATGCTPGPDGTGGSPRATLS